MASALLGVNTEFAASTGAVCKNIFIDNPMCGLSTTLCRGIAKQVLASALVRRVYRPVLPG